MDKSKLKELALAATPGPWKTMAGDGELDLRARFPTGEQVLVLAEGDCEVHPVADCSCNHTCRMDFEQAENAAYIAAANPAAILELLAESERLATRPSVDLSGLTRYQLYDGDMFHNDVAGAYVEYSEVQRLLVKAAQPAAGRVPEGCVLVPVDRSAPQAHPDDIAVDRFAAEMKAKLAQKRAEGYGGWDDPKRCSVERLAGLLVKHLPKADPIDIANFCMMLHQRGANPFVLLDAWKASVFAERRRANYVNDNDNYDTENLEPQAAPVAQEGEQITRNGNVLTCSTCGMSHKMADPYAPTSTDASAAAGLSERDLYNEPRKAWPDSSAQATQADVRDAALEEAAVVCEKKFHARRDSGFPREASNARALRDEIRALKSTTRTPADDSQPAVGGAA